ncbi:MAG: ADP-ribosylglycohydrolase family protein [Candidatus Marinimicrobia bacterium]|nr:ADP-ribosylglycohydrolase family protein [Candidatus Neomarinimicrobiota bacterium]
MGSREPSKATLALLGLALGESLSWSSMYEHSNELPPWLSRIRREIESDMRDDKIRSLPTPFSLNQSPLPLKPGPGDFTEWAAWTSKLLVEFKSDLNHQHLENAWQALANSPEKIGGRLSVQATLRNIEQGMTAPQSGRFNPHYFDDAALSRAAIIGSVFSGNLPVVKQLTKLDASFTQFEEGIWSAVSIASLFCQATHTASITELIEYAIKDLPEGSLSEITITTVLENSEKNCTNVLDTAIFLNTQVCNQIYSYGNIAHEILACVLVILKMSGGDYEKILACSAMVPSPGAGLLSLCVSLATVLNPETRPSFATINGDFFKLRGNSLPEMKEVDLLQIASQLDRLNTSKPQTNDQG